VRRIQKNFFNKDGCLCRDSTGGGGAVTLATLGTPVGLAFDAFGNLCVVHGFRASIPRVGAGADGEITRALDELITRVAAGVPGR
jgi:hypothetical protein